MTYRATKEVVQRVLPLIERMATRSIDKAQLLQYLSARAGVDWGVHDLVSDEDLPLAEGSDARQSRVRVRQITFRGRASGQEHILRYPECLSRLPVEIEPLLVDEYKRLAVDRPLTMMAEPLFAFFFTEDFCAHCRWHRAEHAQIQKECWFAGFPVNFEPLTTDDPERASGADTHI